MRRLLLLALVAGGIATAAAPATAGTCTPTAAGRIRVCVEFMDCGACPMHPRVDPQCAPTYPFSQPCQTIDDLYLDLGPR